MARTGLAVVIRQTYATAVPPVEARHWRLGLVLTRLTADRGRAHMGLLVLLAMIAFAANSVFARLALGTAEIGAAGYTAVRLLAGAVTLALLLLARRHRLQLAGALRSKARWTTAAALFGYAITFSYAYELLGAGMGALILFATVQSSMLG